MSAALPEWYTVYPGISAGYRAPRSPFKAFLSAFEWHNQTLNIYTHLLPGVYFLYKALWPPSCSLECTYIFYAGYLGAAAMGLASAFSHTFSIVDANWNRICSKIDFTGIIAVNLSHQLLDTYVLFRIWKSTYVFSVFCLETLFATWCIYKIWTSDRASNKRLALTYPLLTSIPAIPLYYVADLDLQPIVRASLSCSILVFIAGGLFFKGGFPERYWNPGIFNNFGSHTWHHIFIVASIVSAFEAFPYINI